MFKAEDIMTAPVVAVDEEDTIDQAIALMVKHRISGLPVLDRQGRPLGIVSAFDLLELICEGQTILAKVGRYMSSDCPTVSEKDRWVDVVDVFRSTRARRLLVLGHGKLVGIVTPHDLVHAIRDARQQIRERLSQLDRLPRQAYAEHLPAVAKES